MRVEGGNLARRWAVGGGRRAPTGQSGGRWAAGGGGGRRRRGTDGGSCRSNECRPEDGGRLRPADGWDSLPAGGPTSDSLLATAAATAATNAATTAPPYRAVPPHHRRPIPAVLPGSTQPVADTTATGCRSLLQKTADDRSSDLQTTRKICCLSARYWFISLFCGIVLGVRSLMFDNEDVIDQGKISPASVLHLTRSYTVLLTVTHNRLMCCSWKHLILYICYETVCFLRYFQYFYRNKNLLSI